MNDPGSRLQQVLNLAHQFVQDHRQGVAPSQEALEREHPELAAEIRELFPVMLMLEDCAAEEEPLEKVATEAALAEPPILESIGDYRILREIGRGGMGVVYEAVQGSLGRRVAIKILRRSPADSPGALERFQLEARSAARLNHPNIVPVHDVAEVQGTWYYTMQLVHGVGLDQVLRSLRADSVDSQAVTRLGNSNRTENSTVRASIDDTNTCVTQLCGDEGRQPGRDYFRNIARIGAQVADALACAHRDGIIHRDVKPSNILLNQDGQPLIADFGLVKTAETDLTATGEFVGTLRYMAPERFSGPGDARSDVYSLGATLYELLARRPAFGSTHRIELIREVLTDEPAGVRRFDTRIPQELETIVGKAMERSPELRYQTAGELRDDLQRYLDDRPIRARRPDLWQRAKLWCRRNASIAIMGAVVAASLCVACAGMYLLWRRAEGHLQTSELALIQVREAIDRLYRIQADDPTLPPQLRRKLADAVIHYDHEFIRIKGDDESAQDELAKSYGRVGLLRQMTGQHSEAVAAFLEEIRILETQLSRRGRDADRIERLGAARCNLGASYIGRSELELAQIEFEKAQAVLAKLERPTARSDRFLANAIGNEGLLLRRRGDHDAAIEKRKTELALRRKGSEFGVERMTAAIQLGLNYRDVGQLEQAAEALREIESLHSEVPLENHRLTFIVAANGHAMLADVLRQQGQLPAAEQAINRAVELMRSHYASLPVGSPIAADTYQRSAYIENCRAAILCELGESRRARTIVEELLTKHRTIRSEHPHVAMSLQLARLLTLLSKLSEDGAASSQHDAMLYLNEAIELIEHEVGESDGLAATADWHDLALLEQLGISLRRFAYLQMQNRNTDAARGNLERAVRLHERLVAERPRMPQYALELARDYRVFALLELDDGSLDQGSQHSQQALDILDGIQQQAPLLVETYREKALVLGTEAFYNSSAGKPDQAIEQYRLAVECWSRFSSTHQPGDPQFAIMRGGHLCNLGRALLSKQDSEQAGDLALQAVQVLERVAQLTPEAPRVDAFRVNALLLLAECLRHQDDHEEALAALDRIVSVCRNSQPAPRIMMVATRTLELAPPDDEFLADSYFQRVVSLLGVAGSKGYFQTTAQRDECQRQFRRLDGRADYEAFLASVSEAP